MKEKIILLNCLYFQKNNTMISRLGYILIDNEKKSNTNIFKGFSELSTIYENKNLNDILPIEIFGKIIECDFESIPNQKIKLYEKRIIKNIAFNGKNYYLV